MRPKLTYANVMATIAVFIALGGASYAATQLPKNSVGTGQLKNGAVTKRKISKKTVSSLRGATGPKGQMGPQGPMGPMGPGATAFEAEVPSDGGDHVLKNIDGVLLESLCVGSTAALDLKSENNSSTLDASGTANVTGFGVRGVDKAGTNQIGYVATGSPPLEVDLDLIVRNSEVSRSFFRIDAHVSNVDCRVWAMVTPSTSD